MKKITDIIKLGLIGALMYSPIGLSKPIKTYNIKLTDKTDVINGYQLRIINLDAPGRAGKKTESVEINRKKVNLENIVFHEANNPNTVDDEFHVIYKEQLFEAYVKNNTITIDNSYENAMIIFDGNDNLKSSEREYVYDFKNKLLKMGLFKCMYFDEKKKLQIKDNIQVKGYIKEGDFQNQLGGRKDYYSIIAKNINKLIRKYNFKHKKRFTTIFYITNNDNFPEKKLESQILKGFYIGRKHYKGCEINVVPIDLETISAYNGSY